MSEADTLAYSPQKLYLRRTQREKEMERERERERGRERESEGERKRERGRGREEERKRESEREGAIMEISGLAHSLSERVMEGERERE